MAQIVLNDHVADQRFRELVQQHQVQTVVETGTCAAQGTLAMSQYVPLVVSSEIVRTSWETSCRIVGQSGYPWQWLQHDYMRCFHGPNGWIVLAMGDSPAVIRDVLQPGAGLARPILFFLDAHWLGVWPLQEELKAIAEANVPDSLIVIHDFKSPGTNFGYDYYNGHDLDLAYVTEPLLKINPRYKLDTNTECRMAGPHDPRGILYAVPPLD